MSMKTRIVMPEDSRVAKRAGFRLGRSGIGLVLLATLAVPLAQAASGSSAFGAEALPEPQAGEQSHYAGTYSVVDLSPTEILADFPELQGLEPSSDQERLRMLMDKVGVNVAAAYQRLTSVAADEDITAQKYGYDGRLKSTLRHHFYYIIQVERAALNDHLKEYRADARMAQVESPGVEEGFAFSRDFASQWMLLYPGNQAGSRFRYLGKQLNDGRQAYVLAFAERPGRAAVTGSVNYQGKSELLLYQGLVWIDALSDHIVKLRLDLLEPCLEVGLERQTTEIKLGEVRIPETTATLWLPLEVTVTAMCKGLAFRNVHHYSKYRTFRVESTIKY
jgi:hypothetical protein